MQTPPVRVAVTLGDPAGIGPEIVKKALVRPGRWQSAELLIIGPEALRPEGLRDGWQGVCGHAGYMPTDGPKNWEMGKASAACGTAALAALQKGAELAKSGEAHSLVTAPVCKEALHLAGEKVEGQTEWLARFDGATRYEMLGLSGSLRVMLLTRHMALRQALDAIEPDSLVWHLELLQETLRQIGIENPKLALAGLNPHASEGGLFGDEEARLLLPALERVRAQGLQVTGPQPADTVFLECHEGKFDGILALYHDQAFIPLKLLSKGRGLTLVAGLSFLRISPVHGTAFDIAGQGRADENNMLAALQAGTEWGRRKQSQANAQLTP